MDKKKTIERVKLILGAPIITLELNEKQFEEAFICAEECYDLFSINAKVRDWDENKKGIWIRNYATAICKEILGRIRGRFGGKVPDDGMKEVVLDYEELLKESKIEKEFLFRLINNEN